MMEDTLKYKIVIDHIETLMKGQMKDQMIPSERSLSEHLKISRMTVRKAIDILVQQGKLYRVQNVGTFIQDQKLFKVFNTLSGFTDEVTASGSYVENDVLTFEEVPVTQVIKHKLNLKHDVFVYHLVRLRKKDGIPMMLQESYMPKDLFPLDASIVKHSIYRYIREHLKLGMSSSIQEIKAIFANENAVNLLKLRPKTPTIQIEQVSYLDSGRIFEYTVSTINQNHYELIVQAMPMKGRTT